ncbi:MAG: hypothetical protein LBS25_05945 [Candidatus Symbiothrix sp.]|nr:hypothetical protein [Candidatus Symbiothrix sp.]
MLYFIRRIRFIFASGLFTAEITAMPRLAWMNETKINRRNLACKILTN